MVDIAIRGMGRAGFSQRSMARLQASTGYPAVTDGLIGRNPCTIRGAGIEQARERPMLDTATGSTSPKPSSRGCDVSYYSVASPACGAASCCSACNAVTSTRCTAP
jgi:hypothetical protein